MSSWIHLFSKFTPEALLFEALVICLLLAAYSAFWILRKRRFGPVENTIPAGVVKAYLNELIVDAEALRAQLFGLLAGAGLQPGDAAKFASLLGTQRAPIDAASFMSSGMAGGAGPTIAADPGMGAKLVVLEGKMADQAKAMETLLLEKARLAAELQSARTEGGGKAAPASDDGAALAKLQEKIRILESKLDEYSVIEDDLANLKRLQQENAQLRSSLSGQAGATATPPLPAAAAPARQAPPPKAEPAPIAEPVLTEVSSVPEPMLEPVLESQLGAVPPPTEEHFDALATEVEKSLAPAAAAAEPLVLTAPPKSSDMPALEEVNHQNALPSSPAGPAAQPTEKSDADLVAEFEKMLNG